jgi:hypothetical protein
MKMRTLPPAGVTRRPWLDHWTETKRVIDGEVRVITCCCPDAGAGRRDCAHNREVELKTPCRCWCHATK